MDSTPDPAQLPTREDLLASLKQCIDEVFSSMFITIKGSAQNASDGEHGGDDNIEVSVEFKGALNGYVLLRCSGQGAEDIARGLLMMEQGDVLDIEEVKDALGECGNMVTGALKSKVLDPCSAFSLGLPAVRSTEDGLKEQCDEAALVYTLTSGVMAAELWVDNAEAA